MSNTSTPSGGGKALLPLIVLAAAVAAGWLWIQKPTDESSLPLTEASAPMLNTIAPAAAEAGEGMSGAGTTTEPAMDHDEDDMTYPPSAPAATSGSDGVTMPTPAPVEGATTGSGEVEPGAAGTMPVPVTIPTESDAVAAPPAGEAVAPQAAPESMPESMPESAPQETVPTQTR